MQDPHDFDTENRKETSVPREDDFSLEDVVREYGGWTVSDLYEDLTQPKPETTEQTPAVSEEPAETEQEPEKPKLHALPSKEKPRRRTQERSPQQLLSDTKKSLQYLPIRTYLTGFFTLLAILLTLWQGMGWRLPIALPSNRTLTLILLGFFILCLLLSVDVLLRGLRQALLLRFNLESSLLLTGIVVLIDGFVALAKERVPFYAPICLGLFLADLGRLRRLMANLRSLQVINSDSEEREGLYRLIRLWHNTDCLAHISSDAALDASSLQDPDGLERALRVYCPMIAVAAAVLSVVTGFAAHQNVLWVLAVLLTGSLPVMGFICYAAPLSRLSQRLQKSGAALLGWRGIKSLCGTRYMILGARDLFPSANVSFNGLKVFGSFRVNQVVSCAGTMMIAADSELEPIFSDLMREYGVRSYPIGSFRRYEGGGYGAEIGGDVVLTGSQRFMRLMGIQLPDDLRVKQAIFLSINGQLAGVFALSYKASGTIRSALQSVQRNRGLMPLLATKDFLISPQLLSQKYKISADSIEFPAVVDRIKLSELETPAEGQPAAVLNKESFSGYSGAVLGARALASATRWGAVFCYLSGIVGLLMMLLLTRTGASDIASAANLTLYLLLWLVPTTLLGLWVRFV